MHGCLFCKIVSGEEPSHKIWENENFVAFLSIFPNTEGFTVLASKKHYSSYAFSVPENVLTGLILAAKEVGRLLDKKLNDVGRTGLILEGFGVNHLHAKLFPMHGTKNTVNQWRPIVGVVEKYFEKYEGYVSSHDCARADDDILKALAKKIR
jgi:histidine triad (HIT) family protein